MKPPKIAWKCLPMRSPVAGTCIAFLMLERFQAPGWAWGVVGTFTIFAWLLFLWSITGTRQVDIFRRYDASEKAIEDLAGLMNERDKERRRV